MKAITLHQPWATLIALGVKKAETRSWYPPKNLLGERIAIHAGKHVAQKGELLREVEQTMQQIMGPDWRTQIPTGAVIATARLTQVIEVNRPPENGAALGTDVHHQTPATVTADLYGDFAPDRIIWLLDDVQQVSPPQPARGFQRLWEWEPDAA